MISRIKGLIASSMQLSTNNTASPAMVGDVAYWDGSGVRTTPLSNWNNQGVAVGVVVVPEGFAPDGRARIIGLKSVDKNGNQSSSYIDMFWGEWDTDTSLTDYTTVPITDNASSASTGSSYDGNLPSDKFTGTASYVDSKVKYNSTYNMIPSPYLGEAPNPEYYKTISGNNALSDFNGLSNTQTLIGLGFFYEAANAAWKYNDGASNLQWYLPAMGELGYIMPRFNVINNTLTTLGGLTIDIYDSQYFWSSSQRDDESAHRISVWHGFVGFYDKDYGGYVRPFAMIQPTQDLPSNNDFIIYCKGDSQSYPELVSALLEYPIGTDVHPDQINISITIIDDNWGELHVNRIHKSGDTWYWLYVEEDLSQYGYEQDFKFDNGYLFMPDLD